VKNYAFECNWKRTCKNNNVLCGCGWIILKLYSYKLFLCFVMFWQYKANYKRNICWKLWTIKKRIYLLSWFLMKWKHCKTGIPFKFNKARIPVCLFSRKKGNPNFIGPLASACFQIWHNFNRILKLSKFKGLKKSSKEQDWLGCLFPGLKTKVNSVQSEFFNCICARNLLIRWVVKL
jgi:hypothetical protein